LSMLIEVIANDFHHKSATGEYIERF